MYSEFFLEALEDNTKQLPVRAEALIVKHHEGKAVVGCGGIDLDEYEQLGFCKTNASDIPRPLKAVYWGGEDADLLFDGHRQVVWDVEWQDHSLQVIHLEWETG